MHEHQYPIVAARRQGYDALLWQVPTIGIAAQAFLVSAALGPERTARVALLLWSLAFLVNGAVIWLFQRLRAREVSDANLMRAYETSRSDEGFAVVHGIPSRFSAYRVWLATLLVFWLVAFIGVVVTAHSAATVSEFEAFDVKPKAAGRADVAMLLVATAI